MTERSGHHEMWEGALGSIDLFTNLSILCVHLAVFVKYLKPTFNFMNALCGMFHGRWISIESAGTLQCICFNSQNTLHAFYFL